MEINAIKVKELVEKYIKIDEESDDEEKLHELAHELDHEVYRNNFYIVLNNNGEESDIVALIVGENEEFFIPIYTDEAEALKAIEYFKEEEGSGEFELEPSSGSDLVEAYCEDDEFLGLAINPPQCDFVIFADTIHDCE